MHVLSSRVLPRVLPPAGRVLPALLVALLALVTLSGCVDGVVRVRVLPDGSGSIAVDLGYETRQWPALFGDPYAGFRSADQLRRFTDPGLIAWSEPEIMEVDGRRRWRGEVFFDDVDDVRLLGRHRNRTIEALGFEADLPGGELALRPGFTVYLDEPLPLLPPRRVGMSQVSLSDDLLEAIRLRIRPVIEGFDVRLEVELPGTVTSFDGLDGAQGRVAHLQIDADRLARAFERRAGLLVDEEALASTPVLWAWEMPATWDDEEATALRQRRARALQWYGAAER